MHTDISRRDMIRAMGLGAAALAGAELGGMRPAWAEDAFTIASTGGSWGDGLKQAYVVNAGFEKRFNTQVSYAHMIDSVIATKAIAQCGNPPFTVPALLNAEAVMLADGGCLQTTISASSPTTRTCCPVRSSHRGRDSSPTGRRTRRSSWASSSTPSG